MGCSAFHRCTGHAMQRNLGLRRHPNMRTCGSRSYKHIKEYKFRYVYVIKNTNLNTNQCNHNVLMYLFIYAIHICNICTHIYMYMCIYMYMYIVFICVCVCVPFLHDMYQDTDNPVPATIVRVTLAGGPNHSVRFLPLPPHTHMELSNIDT